MLDDSLGLGEVRVPDEDTGLDKGRALEDIFLLVLFELSVVFVFAIRLAEDDRFLAQYLGSSLSSVVDFDLSKSVSVFILELVPLMLLLPPRPLMPLLPPRPLMLLLPPRPPMPLLAICLVRVVSVVLDLKLVLLGVELSDKSEVLRGRDLSNDPVLRTDEVLAAELAERDLVEALPLTLSIV